MRSRRAGFLAAFFVLAAACMAAWLLPGRHHAATPPTAPNQAPAAAMAPGAIGALSAAAPAGYTGSAACAACHAPEAAAWLRSHHAHAMAAASPATVIGDFDNVSVAFKGSAARFFRDGDRFMAAIDGPGGKPGVFQITHSFGVAPLQQYLVSFPDGRKQALPWAWDTRPRAAGGQRWFYLHQDQALTAADPLHWTRGMANWNFMCAECHSTELRKNYDASANTFKTTFAEISVGCETCHGPGAAHAAWAQAGRDPARADKGFATAMARRPPADWAADPLTGSPAHGVARPAGDEVETCAICHSRRGELAEDWRPRQMLADTHLPTMLDAGLFEDDGQMKDEVFNDHSFKQSLMYARGVVCTDCHDPHSGQLKLAGAAVCSQCHMPSHFNTVAHTGHASLPGAPDCISCHMPARTYMVVDVRHDHSFRIPRPDISAAIGTPNTCNDCHTDKSFAWAADAVARWHGPVPHGHQNWALAVHAARAGDPAAQAPLLALAADATVPAIARATVLTELRQFPSAETDAATTQALADPDPMVRIAALRGLAEQPPAIRWQRANPLLSDRVAGVRIEAADVLADQPEAGLAPADAARLAAAAREYEAAQRLNADRPEGRANLGGFLLRRGDLAGAEAEYKAGLRLEPAAVPLYVNLADLYRAEGREADAETILRTALRVAPDSAAAHHALGLALIRQKNYAGGTDELRQAAALAPDEARYTYVYAVALQSTGHPDEARRVMAAARARRQGKQKAE